MRYTMAIWSAVCLVVSGCNDPRGGEDPFSDSEGSVTYHSTATPFSTRENDWITVHPTGVMFRIPSGWVAWHLQHRNNLFLSGNPLARAQVPDGGEWDKELARICNAAIPFDRCAAHVGSRGWGRPGFGYGGGVQVRVYDLPDAPSVVEARIVSKVSAAFRVDEVKLEAEGMWRRVYMSYTRRFYDYQATAHVDFRLQSVNNRTLVCVCMYVNGKSGEVGSMLSGILDSVRRVN
jgi:hypothetical protein